MALLAPERIASIVLAEPFLPSLTADDATLETLREAADAAGKGQTDRALDLYLGMRLDGDWRDRLPKARLGAMRRAAGNLAPLLSGAINPALGKATLDRIDVPVTILVASNAGAQHRHVADALTARVPQSRLVTSTANREPGSNLAQALAALR
jgi:hypothetical protein